MSSVLFEIQVFEDQIGGDPKFRIKLPAVPRVGDTLTLPDDHYLVHEVVWQANVPVEPEKGYVWPDTVYYTIRLVVVRKFVD